MSNNTLNIRLRVLSNDEIAFGPGKAELLEAIQHTGSISQAAKSMNMSYRRAWQLVDTMNHCFQSVLVDTKTGGTHGGGASITALGQEILHLFRHMEEEARKASHHDLKLIQQKLKKTY